MPPTLADFSVVEKCIFSQDGLRKVQKIYTYVEEILEVEPANEINALIDDHQTNYANNYHTLLSKIEIQHKIKDLALFDNPTRDIVVFTPSKKRTTKRCIDTTDKKIINKKTKAATTKDSASSLASTTILTRSRNRNVTTTTTNLSTASTSTTKNVSNSTITAKKATSRIPPVSGTPVSQSRKVGNFQTPIQNKKPPKKQVGKTPIEKKKEMEEKRIQELMLRMQEKQSRYEKLIQDKMTKEQEIKANRQKLQNETPSKIKRQLSMDRTKTTASSNSIVKPIKAPAKVPAKPAPKPTKVVRPPPPAADSKKRVLPKPKQMPEIIREMTPPPKPKLEFYSDTLMTEEESYVPEMTELSPIVVNKAGHIAVNFVEDISPIKDSTYLKETQNNYMLGGQPQSTLLENTCMKNDLANETYDLRKPLIAGPCAKLLAMEGINNTMSDTVENNYEISAYINESALEETFDRPRKAYPKWVRSEQFRELVIKQFEEPKIKDVSRTFKKAKFPVQLENFDIELDPKYRPRSSSINWIDENL